MTPDLSVVIPVHNNARTLEKAIASVAAIDGFACEVVVILDACDDESAAVAESMRGAVARLTTDAVRYRNVSQSRNQGIAHAAGRFVTWLDADDWYEPAAIGTMLGLAQENDCDFVKGCGISIDGDRHKIWRPNGVPFDSVFRPREYPAYFDYILTGAAVYRKSFLDRIAKFPPRIRVSEDRFFVWSCLLAAERAWQTDATAYYYDRREMGSLTRTRSQHHFDIFECYDSIKKEFGTDIQTANLDEQFWKQYIRVIEMNIFSRVRLNIWQKLHWIYRAKEIFEMAPKKFIEDYRATATLEQRFLLGCVQCARMMPPSLSSAAVKT